MKEHLMKAARCTKYGPPEVFELIETAIPEPRCDELRIAVKASAVTASDIFIRGSDIPLRFKIPMRLLLGIRKPRNPILGFVFAGVVESVGTKVSHFKSGDRVFGLTGFRFGAYAEYLCIKETSSKMGCVAILPDSIPFEDATAAAYGGSLAIQYMDKGNIKRDDKVLVYGASGTSGIFAVQYGKYLGAHVTGVCSTRNIEFLKSLGVDEVIDYTVSDQVNPGTEFDVVLDSVGKLKSSRLKNSCKDSLKSSGTYVSIDDGDLILSSKRLDQIAELVDSGVITPVVEKVYPLKQIVEAHTYVQQGHKRGGVAIHINE